MLYVFTPVRQTSVGSIARARALSSVTIQYVPAVHLCNTIRIVSVTLFLHSSSLESQSAGAVLLCSHGSCS